MTHILPGTAVLSITVHDCTQRSHSEYSSSSQHINHLLSVFTSSNRSLGADPKCIYFSEHGAWKALSRSCGKCAFCAFSVQTQKERPLLHSNISSLFSFAFSATLVNLCTTTPYCDLALFSRNSKCRSEQCEEDGFWIHCSTKITAIFQISVTPAQLHRTRLTKWSFALTLCLYVLCVRY